MPACPAFSAPVRNASNARFGPSRVIAEQGCSQLRPRHATTPQGAAAIDASGGLRNVRNDQVTVRPRWSRGRERDPGPSGPSGRRGSPPGQGCHATSPPCRRCSPSGGAGARVRSRCLSDGRWPGDCAKRPGCGAWRSRRPAGRHAIASESGTAASMSRPSRVRRAPASLPDAMLSFASSRTPVASTSTTPDESGDMIAER
jgi:hypothetical protein